MDSYEATRNSLNVTGVYFSEREPVRPCNLHTTDFKVFGTFCSFAHHQAQPSFSHNHSTGHGVVAELSWRWLGESCAAAPQVSWCFDA